MKLLNRNKQKGFTIIEVTIVLAIAGLIMAIVFLAVPSLRRNSSNTQRRSDASHLASLVSEYVANNGGIVPTCVGTGSTCVNVNNENFSIIPKANISVNTTGANPNNINTMYIDTGYTCNTANNSLVAGSSTQDFAIVFDAETSSGGTTGQMQCIGQ